MIGIKRFSIGNETNNVDNANPCLGGQEYAVAKELTHTNENELAEPLTLTSMQNCNGNDCCIFLVLFVFRFIIILRNYILILCFFFRP